MNQPTDRLGQPSAFGKVITICDENGFSRVTDLMLCDQPDAAVKSSLYVELLKLDCVDFGQRTASHDLTNPSGSRTDDSGFVSGFFLGGVL